MALKKYGNLSHFKGFIINLCNTTSLRGDKTELVCASISRQMFLSEASTEPVCVCVCPYIPILAILTGFVTWSIQSNPQSTFLKRPS